MIKINVTDDKLYDELLLVTKLFYTDDDIANLNLEFNVSEVIDERNETISVKITTADGEEYSYSGDIRDRKFPDRYKKRYAKILLYKILKKLNPDKKLPWVV